MADIDRHGTRFRLAHLSDVHLSPLPPLALRDWNLKRLLGWVNWQRRRRHLYSRAALDRLVADLAQQVPDHIAVTGDLANLGLPAEHAAALEWLQRLGPAAQVTVIPGNHDIYCPIGDDPGTGRWQEYMSANEGAHAPGPSADRPDAARFPFVRRLGKIALIALNSAVPTLPFYAIGRLGEGQLARLGQILDQLGAEGLMRVVLIHHPPLPGLSKPRHDLLDAAALAEVLATHGAELVLHGHEHIASTHWQPSIAGPIPVIGVPSASLGQTYKKEPLARYHLYELDTSAPRPGIELIARGLAEPTGPVVELDRRRLVPPRDLTSGVK